MGRIEDLLAEKQRLEADIAAAMAEQRQAVVEEVRDKIRRYRITATELKGLIKGRVTARQIEEYIRRKGEKKR